MENSPKVIENEHNVQLAEKKCSNIDEIERNREIKAIKMSNNNECNEVVDDSECKILPLTNGEKILRKIMSSTYDNERSTWGDSWG